MLNTGLAQHLGQFGCCANVVRKVLFWSLHALAHSFVRREVNGAVHRGLKDSLHALLVCTVNGVKLHAMTQDALKTIQHLWPAVAQVVHDDRHITCFGQRNGGVRAYKACSSCHKNAPWDIVLGHAANIGNPNGVSPVIPTSDSVRHGSTMHANHYNLDYLKQVFQGNDAMVLRILDIFEEEVPKYFAEMSQLADAGQWGGLHPLAHKAKSSIGMLGMQRLLTEVLVVENLSRTEGDVAELSAALSRAKTQLGTALEALRSDRAGGLLHSPKLGSEGQDKAVDRHNDGRLYRA